MVAHEPEVGFLHKPFREAELLAKLDEAMRAPR